MLTLILISTQSKNNRLERKNSPMWFLRGKPTELPKSSGMFPTTGLYNRAVFFTFPLRMCFWNIIWIIQIMFKKEKFLHIPGCFVLVLLDLISFILLVCIRYFESLPHFLYIALFAGRIIQSFCCNQETQKVLYFERGSL